MTLLVNIFGGWRNLLIYLLVMNIVGVYEMWSDKEKAKKNRWRTPESVLLMICAIGGGIGTIYGMYKFRHKTKKLKFTVGMPAILVIEIAILLYLRIEKGV